MVDLDDRLEVASRFGATAVVMRSGGKARQTILALTNGRGVDTAIEAVGVPATVALWSDDHCARGHDRSPCSPYHPPVVHAHRRAVGQQHHDHVPSRRDHQQADAPETGERSEDRPDQLVTHRFKLDQIVEAYETFKAVGATKALKVIIEASGP